MAYRSLLNSARTYYCCSSTTTALLRVPPNHGLISSILILGKAPEPAVSRGFKTTSTEHPQPVFDQDEEVLQKVIKERQADMPESLTNPYEKPIRKCILCEQQIIPNYKNVKLLYQFISPYTGMIYPRNVTGLCKRMQEILEHEIKKARTFGLMAYYLKEVEFLKDPKLCDPERPLLPHRY